MKYPGNYRSLLLVGALSVLIGITVPVILGAGPSAPDRPTVSAPVLDSLRARIRSIENALGIEGAASLSPRPDEAYRALVSRVEALAQIGDSALAHIPSIAPVPRPRITSPYTARRLHPVKGTVQPHFGLDLAAPQHTPIRATASGTVASVAVTPEYGNSVEVDHGNGYLTRYAHAATVLVRPGQSVRRGQTIARVGATGQATGPHVHYEVFLDGWSVDPYRLITEPGLEVEDAR